MTNIGEWDAFRNIDMDKEVCFSLCMLKEQPFFVYSQITVHMSFNYDCQRAGPGSILTLPSHILAGHRLVKALGRLAQSRPLTYRQGSG